MADAPLEKTCTCLGPKDLIEVWSRLAWTSMSVMMRMLSKRPNALLSVFLSGMGGLVSFSTQTTA